MTVGHTDRVRALRRTALAVCVASTLAVSVFGRADSSLAKAASSSRGNDVDGASVANATKLSALPHATIVVDNCLDDGSPGTLRAAFDQAVAGDTIDLRQLQCSPITLQTGAIKAVVPDLTVLGPGPEYLAVSGNLTDSVIVSKYDLDISGLTITYGSFDSPSGGFGGCIFTVGNLTLRDSLVTGCVAGSDVSPTASGGGVHVGGNLYMYSSTIKESAITAAGNVYGGGAYVTGNVLLKESTISGNFARAGQGWGLGGGLFALGSIKASHSTVMENYLHSEHDFVGGGGIYGGGGLIRVGEGSSISGNEAISETKWSNGGGIVGGTFGSGVETMIYLVGSTLSDNTVRGNCFSCSLYGGGALAYGAIFASHSTISGNRVQAASMGKAVGGGLATIDYLYGTIDLLNSTVSGNQAIGGSSGGSGYGGGIATALPSQFVALNSTIAFNQASHFGGGAAGNVRTGITPAPYLSSSIVANNQAPIGVDIAKTPSSDPFSIGGSNNLVMLVGNGVAFTEPPITADPILQPLTANNGGATATHALGAGSPAIDQGANLDGLGCDQRSAPFARTFGAGPDIGAFEVQSPPDYIFGSPFEATYSCP